MHMSHDMASCTITNNPATPGLLILSTIQLAVYHWPAAPSASAWQLRPSSGLAHAAGGLAVWRRPRPGAANGNRMPQMDPDRDEHDASADFGAEPRMAMATAALAWAHGARAPRDRPTPGPLRLPSLAGAVAPPSLQLFKALILASTYGICQTRFVAWFVRSLILWILRLSAHIPMRPFLMDKLSASAGVKR